MRLDHDDTKKIKELLLGKRVVSAEGYVLTLDDGTEIEVEPNDGCGGCISGYYELESISKVDNVITDVNFDYQDVSPLASWSDKMRYSVFVFADNEQINLLTVEGDDGSGYYGTGFRLNVKLPEYSGDGS